MESSLLGVNFELTAAVVAVGAVVSTVIKYIELAVRMSKENPKKMAAGLLGGAWYFSYNMLSLQFQFVPKTDQEVFFRWCFSFAAISMALGPFLLFTPTRPVVLKKDTLFKQLVIGAQKKETRYFTLAVFFCLTVLQGVVVYALWAVLNDILHAELRLTIGVCVGYALVSILYLVVFYSVMMKKPVIIKGIDFMQVFRSKVVFKKQDGTVIDILNHKHYVKLYLLLFVCFFGLCIYIVASLFIMDMNNLDHSNRIHMLIVGSYFALDIVSIIVLTIFILNVAFHPLNVSTEAVLEDGTIIDLSQIRFFAIARSKDRTLLCRQALRGDPKSGEIEEKVLHEIDTAPVDPGYKNTIEDVQSNVALHQSNDAKCMFFLATGVLYDRSVAFYFMDEAQDHTEQTFYRFTGLESYSFNAWTNAMEPFLTQLFTKFSHKDSMNQLISEAKVHQREKDEKCQQDSMFQEKVEKREQEMTQLMQRIQHKEDFFPQLAEARLAAKLASQRSLLQDSSIDDYEGTVVEFKRLKVQAGIEQVKAVMSENIDRVLQRGEALDMLEMKADELSDQSLKFQKKATSIRKKKALFPSKPTSSSSRPTKLKDQAREERKMEQKLAEKEYRTSKQYMEEDIYMEEEEEEAPRRVLKPSRILSDVPERDFDDFSMPDRELQPMRSVAMYDEFSPSAQAYPSSQISMPQSQLLPSSAPSIAPPLEPFAAPPSPLMVASDRRRRGRSVSPPPSTLSRFDDEFAPAFSPVVPPSPPSSARLYIPPPPPPPPPGGAPLPPPPAFAPIPPPPPPPPAPIMRDIAAVPTRSLSPELQVYDDLWGQPTRGRVVDTSLWEREESQQQEDQEGSSESSWSIGKRSPVLSSQDPRLLHPNVCMDHINGSCTNPHCPLVHFNLSAPTPPPPPPPPSRPIVTRPSPPLYPISSPILISPPLRPLSPPILSLSPPLRPLSPPLRSISPPVFLPSPRRSLDHHVIQIDPVISAKFDSVEVEIKALSQKLSGVERRVATSQNEILFTQGSHDRDFTIATDDSGRLLTSGDESSSPFWLAPSGLSQCHADFMPWSTFPIVFSDRPISRFSETPLSTIEFTLTTEPGRPIAVTIGFASKLVSEMYYTPQPMIEYCSWNGHVVSFENFASSTLLGLPLTSGDVLSVAVDLANHKFLFAKNGVFVGSVVMEGASRWDLTCEIFACVRFLTTNSQVSICSDQNKLKYRHAFGEDRLVPFAARDLTSLYSSACSPTLARVLDDLANFLVQELSMDPSPASVFTQEAVAWLQQKQTTFLSFAIDYLLQGKRKLSQHQQRALQYTVTTGLAFLHSRVNEESSAFCLKLLSEFVNIFAWPVHPSPSAACFYLRSCQAKVSLLQKQLQNGEGRLSGLEVQICQKVCDSFVECCNAIASVLSQS